MSQDNALCGVLVAGNSSLPWAYMLPIEDIFNNMKLVLGTDNVSLPVAGEIITQIHNDMTQGLSRTGELYEYEADLTRNCRTLDVTARAAQVHAQSTSDVGADWSLVEQSSRCTVGSHTSGSLDRNLDDDCFSLDSISTISSSQTSNSFLNQSPNSTLSSSLTPEVALH